MGTMRNSKDINAKPSNRSLKITGAKDKEVLTSWLGFSPPPFFASRSALLFLKSKTNGLRIRNFRLH